MKRMLLIMFVALSVAVAMTVSLASTGGMAWADGGKGVAVQPLTPKAGDVITVKGDQLGPGSRVEVRVLGTGVDVDLGEVQADAQGDFSAQFRLPENLKPGTYQVMAKGAESAVASITLLGIGGDASSQGAMGGAPVLRERPLGERVLLVAVFGVVAAAGIFLARTAREKPEQA